MWRCCAVWYEGCVQVQALEGRLSATPVPLTSIKFMWDRYVLVAGTGIRSCNSLHVHK
jgi:hypothetical protein